MNLMTGLIWPTKGSCSVLGLSAQDPERFFRVVGYCTQFDSFAKGITGREFVYDSLRLHGLNDHDAAIRTKESLERVHMLDAADRKIAAYSKGMRQRVRLAQSISHRPRVLVLDEPLNGLDPMARSESMALFSALGQEGMHVIISSHILHEVDRISDQVILLSSGYVVAEGQIQGVRDEVKEHPMQIMVRCSHPALLAAKLFAQEHIVEAKLHHDGNGLLVRTRDADRFYRLLQQLVLEGELDLEAVSPADDDVNSVYQYLIGSEGAAV
jgi:ABC-2 type transport system ATP-binding protein